MWILTEGPTEVPSARDSRVFAYAIERDGIKRMALVELSGTVMACEPETLPSPIDDAVRSNGETLLRSVLAARDEPPRRIVVNTTGWTS